MNSKLKKGLGRGLSSLIGETKVENKTNKLIIKLILFQININQEKILMKKI